MLFSNGNGFPSEPSKRLGRFNFGVNSVLLTKKPQLVVGRDVAASSSGPNMWITGINGKQNRPLAAVE